MNSLHLRSNLEKFGMLHDKKLKNLKILADEMANILIEKKRREVEVQFNNEPVFYDLDIQSVKHKSQVFNDRNHNKMLTKFSLNKSNEDTKNSKDIINKKKNKFATAQNGIDFDKKKLSFHLSIKPQMNINDNNNDNIKENSKNSNNNNIKENTNNNSDKNDNKNNENKIEKKIGGYILEEKIFSDVDEFSIKDEKEEENFYEEEFLDPNNIFENESEESIKEKHTNENYEIIYIDPTNINTKEREELTTRNEEKKINNELRAKTLKEIKNKGKYLFERGIKMLNQRENKRKKAQEISENEIKGFFDVKNFITKTPMRKNKNKANKNKKYVPLHYKALEMHLSHLSQIKINQKNNLIKKQINENKQMKKAKIKDYNIKKRLSKKSWNDFIKKENEWKKNKTINREALLKNKYKNMIYDRPKINKNSIIMLEQKKENKEKRRNIYTKLYLDKEIYDNKLKLRIINSTPSFTPKIYRSKRQKTLKNLTDINTSKNDNYIKNKTTNNKSGINILLMRNIKINQKIKKKEISLSDYNFSPKLITSNTTNKRMNKGKVKNKENINKKKTFVYELNINDYNFNKKNNKSKLRINDPDINSCIKKLGDNATKALSLDKINNAQNMSNINDIQRNKKENIDELNNKKNEEVIIKNNINKNEHKEKKKKRKKLEMNNYGQFLYDLNLRDNTTNSLKQFVVLTSKKYIDFFK